MTGTPTPLEAALQAATGVKLKKGEKPQGYYRRIVEAIDNLPSEGDTWDTLPEAAQKWFNEATTAIAAAQPIADFPDRPVAVEPAPAATPPAAVDKAADTPTAGPKPAAKAPAKKAPAKPAAKAADKAKPKTAAVAPKPEAKKKGRPDKTGVMTRIKAMILKNPKMSSADIYKKLETTGQPPPSMETINTVRSGFRHSLRVIIEAGMLKGTVEL